MHPERVTSSGGDGSLCRFYGSQASGRIDYSYFAKEVVSGEDLQHSVPFAGQSEIIQRLRKWSLGLLGLQRVAACSAQRGFLQP